jgi:hypothetical protein
LQRLEGEGLGLAWCDLGQHRAAARAVDRMQVDVVHHDAVGGVLQAEHHGVADADPQHRARHLAVEGPEIVGRVVGQLADPLDRFQVVADGDGTAFGDRRGHVGRIARYAGGGVAGGLDFRGLHFQHALHARLTVAGDVADIDEAADVVGIQHQRAAGIGPSDMLRADPQVGHDEVVFGALAVDHGDLHDVALMHRQSRVDLAVDIAAAADIDHLALGDPAAQGERGVGDRMRHHHWMGGISDGGDRRGCGWSGGNGARRLQQQRKPKRGSRK